MKIVCTICADTLQDDFVAAPCGHTFHQTCLTQWLAHQKSCPQCRDKCLPRQILRLFLDSGSTTCSLDENSGYENLSLHDLKEHLQEQSSLVKHKDEALLKARQELEDVRKELTAWQAQYEMSQFKLDKERGVSESLKHQLKLVQKEKDDAEERAQYAENLQKKLVKLEKIQLLLNGDREDAQHLIDNSSHSNLSSYIIALKSEYESMKERKAAMQKEKDKHFKDITQLKRNLRSQELELLNTKARLSTIESDLHAAESERDNLTKKVQLLEKALESPGSRTALRRILESPLPDLVSKRAKLDLAGSSPQLTSSFHNEQENNPIKSIDNISSVLMPVQKSSSTKINSLNISSGFNGLGGHTKFVIPKSRPSNNAQAKKPLKFAPRTGSFTGEKLPAMKLKF